MYTFTDAVIDSKYLDPRLMAERRMKSVVMPEFPTSPELREVATLLDERDFDVWAYQFGLAEDYMTMPNIDAVTRYYNEESYQNMLIRYNGHDLSFWIPESHEFFVMFGNAEAVDRVLRKGIFVYHFAEYLQAPHLNKVSKDYLLEMQRKYTVL